MISEICFRAMGTEVEAKVWSPDVRAAQAALTAIPALFEELEQELSRFRQTSGLCVLNAAAGQGPQSVSPILADVCRMALEAAEWTEGVFDPTVLAALEHAGYDDSFAVVASRPPGAAPPAPTSRPRWHEVRVGDDNTITLPAGVHLDFGGIAKGFAVDQVAEWLRAVGPAMVDAGGDIRTTARMPDAPWRIAVSDPHHPDFDIETVELDDAAVTTSSVGRRRWKRGDSTQHHLIDPRTQQPSTSDVHTVTVVGPTAVRCEIAAKVALLLGMTEGAMFLREQGLDGLLVGYDGSTRTIGKSMGDEE